MTEVCKFAQLPSLGTAARIVSRLRAEIDGPAEIEAVIAEEDGETIIIYAGAPGRTVTATASVAELGGVGVRDFEAAVQRMIGAPVMDDGGRGWSRPPMPWGPLRGGKHFQ